MVRNLDRQTKRAMDFDSGRAPCVQVLISIIMRRAQTKGRWKSSSSLQCRTQLCRDVDEDHRVSQFSTAFTEQS